MGCVWRARPPTGDDLTHVCHSSSSQTKSWQRRSTCHCTRCDQLLIVGCLEGHHHPAQDLVQNYSVDYIAGGATQNTIRVAQWLLQVKDATTYIGCVGKDDYADKMRAACAKDGVNVCVFLRSWEAINVNAPRHNTSWTTPPPRAHAACASLTASARWSPTSLLPTTTRSVAVLWQCIPQ